MGFRSRDGDVASRGNSADAVVVQGFKLDPTVSYNYIDWRVLHLIGDGLVAFKAVGGSDGATLVPDLATAIPTPTDDGRTYTFELTPGIHYSNGEVVVPADFRHAIERGFHLPMPTTGTFMETSSADWSEDEPV